MNNIGVGAAGFILFVVFLILKLCSVIACSWWWVTAPLWIPTIFVAVVIAVAVVLALCTGRPRSGRSSLRVLIQRRNVRKRRRRSDATAS